MAHTVVHPLRPLDFLAVGLAVLTGLAVGLAVLASRQHVLCPSLGRALLDGIYGFFSFLFLTPSKWVAKYRGPQMLAERINERAPCEEKLSAGRRSALVGKSPRTHSAPRQEEHGRHTLRKHPPLNLCTI